MNYGIALICGSMSRSEILERARRNGWCLELARKELDEKERLFGEPPRFLRDDFPDTYKDPRSS